MGLNKDETVTEISSPEDLRLVGEKKEGKFVLTEDIDFNYGVSWKNNYVPDSVFKLLSSNIFTPIEEFNGHFDGNGHEIKKLPIIRTKASLFKSPRYMGLFSSNRGVIENLNLKDIEVHGGLFVGGITGENSGVIRNCSVEGTVKGGDFTGGLVGHNIKKESVVKNCSFYGKVSGSEYVGGIVGKNDNEIRNCSSEASIKANRLIGGVTGKNTKKIERCFSEVKIKGDSYVGGIVGENKDNLKNSCCKPIVKGEPKNSGIVAGRNEKTVENCYWTSKKNYTRLAPIGCNIEDSINDVSKKSSKEKMESSIIAGEI